VSWASGCGSGGGICSTHCEQFDLEESVRGADEDQLLQLWDYVHDEPLPGLDPDQEFFPPSEDAAKFAVAELRELRESIDVEEYKGTSSGVLLVLILAPIDAATEALEQSPENWSVARETIQTASSKLSLARRILAYAPGLNALADLAEKAGKVILEAVGRGS
jgi:hypothetical protein